MYRSVLKMYLNNRINTLKHPKTLSVKILTNLILSFDSLLLFFETLICLVIGLPLKC